MTFNHFKIIVVLILGMLFLGLLTFGIGKVYLDLVGHSKSGNSLSVQNNLPNSSENNMLILPEIKFWTCQVGVFQKQSNAQLCVERLRASGYYAELFSNTPWSVGLGWGHSSHDLAGFRQSLAEKGISSLPKEIVLPERRFRVAGNFSELTKDLLTYTNDLLGRGLSTETLVKEKQSWEALAGKNPPKDLERLHQLFNQIRGNGTYQDENFWGLSLYCEFQRIIYQFSGK